MTPYQNNNFMRTAGAIVWTVGLFGATWALIGDQFLGQDFNDWMIVALVGWCNVLTSKINRVRFVKIVEIDREADA